MINHHRPQRAAHAINLLAMLVLAFTGFYIHNPFAPGMMGTMRYLHFTAAYVLLINLAWRVYYAFFGRWRDYREFRPHFSKLLAQVRYYLFLSRDEAKDGKYNSLQRLAYLGVALLLVLQAVTGFAIGWPHGSMAFLVNRLGLAELRALHYLGTWVFITFVIVHVYLVFTETPRAFLEMFLGWERRELKVQASKQVAYEHGRH